MHYKRHKGSRYQRERTPQNRVNRQIRAKEILVIGSDNKQLGVLTPAEALEIARNEDLDLVEVAPNAKPPVCKIMDYGKFQYEKSRREKEARKKQAKVVFKEIQFRPDTAEHDYQFKMRHAREFLSKNYKVRATVRFRGREMLHTELGRKMLDRLIEDLADIAEVEQRAKMEARSMLMILSPIATKSKTKSKTKAKNKEVKNSAKNENS